MNLPHPQFGAGFDTNIFHLTPTVFIMRGEHEDGSEAGLMIGFSWFGFVASIVYP